MINGRKLINYNEVSAALMNYEVRRHDRLSSSGSTAVEALVVRGRSFNRKGRGDQERSKFRSDFKYLKRNQCVLCKELGYRKVDCPKAKGKKKELMKRQISRRWLVLMPIFHMRRDRNQTHRYFLSLLRLLLLVSQLILSGS